MNEQTLNVDNQLPGFNPSVEEPSGADFGDSPLADFWGVGAGYEVKGGTNQRGNAWQRVYFRWTDVDVLSTVSNDPYPFQTAEVSIFYSDPQKTPKRKEGQGTNDWEIFSESIRGVYKEKAGGGIGDMFGGQVLGEGSQPEKPGRRMHMKRVPSLVRVGPRAADEVAKLLEKAGSDEERAAINNLSKWHDELVPAWKVVEVEGVGSTVTGGNGGTPAFDIGMYVIDLADGKLPADFYEVAMDDDKVMANPTIITQLSERTFIDNMKNASLLTQDEAGVLHKVAR